MHQRVYRSRLVNNTGITNNRNTNVYCIIHNVDLLVLRENLLSVPSS